MNVYRGKTALQDFAAAVGAKKVLAVYDINTKPFAEKLIKLLDTCQVTNFMFDDRKLVPELEKLPPLVASAKESDYIVCIGSGTLNDICKYASFKSGVPYGVYATAPSMDGYVSSISALYENGKKVTVPTTVPADVIIDVPLLAKAPLDMIVAGAGDMIGKYTSLLDWKLAYVLKGESYDEEIVARMQAAASLCLEKARALVARDELAVEALAEGLILSGIEMQNAGNSRPASGAEHHISHYLEMAAEKDNTYFAPHGVQVALGALAVIAMYRVAAEMPELAPIADDINALPTVEELTLLYHDIGLPTRFSEIGVSEALLDETLKTAYTVRDRYTVMSFLKERGVLEEIAGKLHIEI